MSKNIPVVILCGGMGTRLREETEYKPKPMVEIGGKPILWHIMKHYAHFGFRKFILCLGYKGSVIKDYFLNYEAMSNDFTINLGKGNHLAYQSNHTEQDFNVTLVDTGLKTMTGGRVKRAGNVIGGGDWGADRLVPDCIRALSRHQPIGIRSPHHAVRPWQHVLEPLSGYLQLGAALWQDPQKYSGAWNFGPDDGSHLKVAEMADRLIKYWGDGSWEDLSDPQALHEANLLKLNCDKAHAELHWHGVLTNDECLQMTAQWYKIFYAAPPRDSMYEICTQQIAEYVDRARR